MLISDLINDSFGFISKQLKFYCPRYRRDLDQRQRQELIDVLHEQQFERLANKIKSLIQQNNVPDRKQQIGQLLFEQCVAGHRRHQLIQLIESNLLDINVRLDNYGRTLLHRAAYNLDVELVKLLIDHGVDIRLYDFAKNTALHIAIQSYRNGNVIYNNSPDVVQNLISIIKLLLEADKNLQNDNSKCKKMKVEQMANYLGQSNCPMSMDRNELGLITSKSINIDSMNNSNYRISPSSSSYEQVNSNQINVVNSSPRFLQQHQQCEGNLIISDNESIQCNPFANHHSETIDHRKERNSKAIQVTDSNSIPPNNNSYSIEGGSTNSLIDAKNEWGRTALHYCVLVVGEHHLARFVELLISFGADPDAVDSRLRTPLYCLVKRAGISAIRQKCLAIAHLLNSGCDDLGIAIKPNLYFTDELIRDLEKNISTILRNRVETDNEPIFAQTKFERVPSLKHLARLSLIKVYDGTRGQLNRQKAFSLPPNLPATLNHYVNRKILDQSELF